MLFSSITFLYYFLPVTLTVYFLTPKKRKNLVLLFASLLFYGWVSRSSSDYAAVHSGQHAFGLSTENTVTKHRRRPGWPPVAFFAHRAISNTWIFLSPTSTQSRGFLYCCCAFRCRSASASHISDSQLYHRCISGDVKAQRSPSSWRRTLRCSAADRRPTCATPMWRCTESRTHSVRRMSRPRLSDDRPSERCSSPTRSESCALFGETQNETVLFAWMYAAALRCRFTLTFPGTAIWLSAWGACWL